MKAGKRIETSKDLLGLLDEYDELLERLEGLRERLSLDTATHEVWREAILERPKWRRLIAHNKRLDDETLRQLARDEDPMVRGDIARKNTFPPDLFEGFANDQDSGVRTTLAGHSKTPVEILRKLSTDPDEWVAKVAADNLSRKMP